MFRRGFTLVELLIVVIIIAILASIAIPKFMNSNQASREASLHGNLRLVRDAISRFNTDTGLWPMTLNELTLMPGDPSATQGKDSTNHVGNLPAKSFNGPYMLSIPADPTANASFIYNSSQPPTIGDVNANPGIALDGSNYSTW